MIGYGPEMMSGISPTVYRPKLGQIEDRNALADRAHNHLLDLLTMNGALGLLAYLLLIGNFFYHGISRIWRTESLSMRLTLIALLSAVFAHFVETQVGIALVTTQMLLWLYMALLVVIDRLETGPVEEQVEPIASTSLDSKMNWRDPNVRWLIYSLITAFILIFFATTTNINLIRADINFERCYDLAEAGALKEAVDACHQATRLSPNQARYHRLRAELLLLLARAIPDSDVDLKTELLQSCERAMRKARQLTPLAAEYYADTGKLYGYWGETIDPSKFEQAVKFYHQAFQIAPHDADFRNGLGHIYFNAGQYEEAIRQYEHSLSIDPQYHATHYDLGLVYVELGEKDKAQEHFETALLLDPGCEECAQQLESLEDDQM
jgi:tetratricopeptide (TPR) repeat protein